MLQFLEKCLSRISLAKFTKRDVVNDVYKALVDLLENNASDNKWLRDYLQIYSKENVLNSYYNIFRENVYEKCSNYKATIGLDLGCWFGVSTILYSQFGNKKILATDFWEPNEVLFNNFRDSFKIRSPILYFKNSLNNSGITDNIEEKLDWIILYDVLCNTNYRGMENLLKTCLSLLKDGAFLFITDFSYGNEDDFKTIENRYRENEIGDGSKERPNGVWFNSRYRYIQEKYSALTEDEVWSYAYGTVGCNLAEIDVFISGANDQMAQTYDNPAIFVNPTDKNKTGMSYSLNKTVIGNLLDIDMVLQQLINAGFNEERIEVKYEKDATCRFYLHAHK